MGANAYYSARNKGMALLFMLLGIAIVMIGAYLVLNPRPSFDSLEKQELEPEKYPWLEEKRIEKNAEDISKPEIEQPQLERTVIYKATAQENGKDRGLVLIKVDSDGLVEVRWLGEYMTAEPRMEFQVLSSSAQGNIDPSKLYEDGDNIDYEKLYLITKGNFQILETNHENGKIRKTRGFLYLTGWLDKQEQIKGYVSITSDKNTVKVFDYVAEKTDMLFLPESGSLMNLLKAGLPK